MGFFDCIAHEGELIAGCCHGFQHTCHCQILQEYREKNMRVYSVFDFSVNYRGLVQIYA